jgi:hypothetical protein
LAAAKKWMANDKDDTFLGGGIFSIGEALIGLRRYKEAEAHLRDIWKRPKPMSTKVAAHAVMLALALVCREEFAEAKDVLLEATKGHAGLWNGYYVPWALLYVHSRSPKDCPSEIVDAALAKVDKWNSRFGTLNRSWGVILTDGILGRRSREETLRELDSDRLDAKPKIRERLQRNEVALLTFYEALAHLRAGREEEYLSGMYEYVTMPGVTDHYYEWFAAEHELIRRPGRWKRKYEQWLRAQKAAREAKREKALAKKAASSQVMEQPDRLPLSSRAKSARKSAAKSVAKQSRRKRSEPASE